MTPEEVSALMKRGIALLDANTSEELMEAVACFDAAIDLRRSCAPDDHRAAYLLAASWMNRGDALTRLGGAEALQEALLSYDEALAALRNVPPDLDPDYRRRHAIAWLNRGVTLRGQATAPAMEEAIRSFERAADTVKGYPEHDLLLAGASINHARALLAVEPPRAAAARDIVLLALERVTDTTEHSAPAADIALKARILLCHAAKILLASSPAQPEARALVSEATDAVETGLLLARTWEERGATHLTVRPTVLFRIGLDLYRRRQPQFLAEFIRENLQGSENLEWHHLAAETLAAEARTDPREGFSYLNTPRQTTRMEALQTLRFVEQRIGQLSPTSNKVV